MTNQSTILRLREVKSITGLPQSSIYYHIQHGAFPKQIKLGARSSGWLSSEIQAWIDSRASARAGSGK